MSIQLDSNLMAPRVSLRRAVVVQCLVALVFLLVVFAIFVTQLAVDRAKYAQEQYNQDFARIASQLLLEQDESLRLPSEKIPLLMEERDLTFIEVKSNSGSVLYGVNGVIVDALPNLSQEYFSTITKGNDDLEIVFYYDKIRTDNMRVFIFYNNLFLIIAFLLALSGVLYWVLTQRVFKPFTEIIEKSRYVKREMELIEEDLDNENYDKVRLHLHTIHEQFRHAKSKTLEFYRLDVLIENYLGSMESLVARMLATNMSLAEANEKLEKNVNDRTSELLENHDKLEVIVGQLKEIQAKMFQQEKLATIGNLAAGVAHEINNPTGFVRANLRTLSEYRQHLQDFMAVCRDSVKTTEDINQLKDAITQAHAQHDIEFILDDSSTIISDCLEGMGRIAEIVQSLKSHAHTDDRSFQYTDINELVYKTLNITRNELKYVAEVETELEANVQVEINFGKISQVLSNLLINARDAIQDYKGKGVIKIHTYNQEDMVYLEVIDDGPGIEPSTLQHIFDPFYTTKEAGKGTGLGLNISYDIVVNGHFGALHCDSEVGRGTRFIVELPVNQPRD